jgi:dTDP-4-dehydrorhamnose reductase
MLPSLIKEHHFDLVIHCASIGSVDYAMQHPGECRTVNVLALEKLINACLATETKLIFISSNAVYGGENPPYAEEAPLDPINIYGELKAEGERLTKSMGKDKQMIIRPILLFGWNAPDHRPNPVSWQLDRLKKGEHTTIVDDKYSNPILVQDCAKATWSAIEKKCWGQSFNLGGPEKMSRYDFALKVCHVFGFKKSLISPVKSSAFKELAPRPNDTTFNITKMQKVLGIKPLYMEAALEWMKANGYSLGGV